MTSCHRERRGTINSILGTNHPFQQGTDGHDTAIYRGRKMKCDKCLGLMAKQDEAFVCVRCGKYKYLDRLPRANQELAEAFRPSIKTIRYKGEVPRFQNKFPCRYQRCGGDMKQGARNPYRKEEGWKVVSFHCTKNDIHQNRIYENERGEAVNWE